MHSTSLDGIKNDMNPGYRDLAAGAFDSGLAKLDGAPEWHDDRTDLNGPFRLSFPRAQGWGEGLLVASLLKRHAAKSAASVKVFAKWQVCSILKHDSVYDAQLCEDSTVGRSPLAVLQHALLGDLLEKPFIPISRPDARPTSPTDRRSRVGIAWASVSNNRLISEKSVPLEQFLLLLRDIDVDFISLQHQLDVADPTGLLSNFGVSTLADEVLDTTTENSLDALVETIRSLDRIVTISTTVTHIAAAMGIRVELLAAERGGPQWFWQVQANHHKCIYPTVRVHLGNGKEKKWWEKSFEALRASLLNQ
jgi:hypothetical protein